MRHREDRPFPNGGDDGPAGEMTRLDRRKEPRKKTALHSFACDLGQRYEIKCVIRDVSRTGCKIVSKSLADLPDVIQIHPEDFGKPVHGRIVWRDKSIAGVQFVSAKEAQRLHAEWLRRSGDASRTGKMPLDVGVGDTSGFRDRFRFFARREAPIPRASRSGQAASERSATQRILASVAGELRKSLSAVLDALERIRSRFGATLPSEVTALISVAQRNARRMTRMVDDPRGTHQARSDDESGDQAPVALSQLVSEAIAHMEPCAMKYGIHFRLDNRAGDAHVSAEARELSEVLYRLLEEAARSSAEGRAVDVTIERTGPHLKVSVRIRRTGSSPVDPSSFDETNFAALEEIVQRHDGEIGRQPDSGSGAVTYFEIPEHRLEPVQHYVIAS